MPMSALFSAESRPLTIALAGNPNSGKSTVFNHYTGARQHVANYPGITVEIKEGFAKTRGKERIRILDLPGAYALTAYSQDELVARRGLTLDPPDAVIGVLNAGALERHLYLAVQIMELGLPLVLALNMYDEAQTQGLEINIPRLSELLELPVFPTVARQGLGLNEALEAGALAAEASRAGKGKAPLILSYGPDLDALLEELCLILEKSAPLAGFPDAYPRRWIAVKCLENDAEILTLLQRGNPALAEEIRSKTTEAARHLKLTSGTDPESLIADYRYGFISSLLRREVLRSKEDPRQRRRFSENLDKILTHRLLGPILLLAALYGMYKITFGLGQIPTGWLENFFALLREAAAEHLPEGALKSLILSGILAGVGGVLSFVPLILIIFILISILEDSGYMARAAYMLDRIFRAFGLHGSSVMPYIISGGIAGGCAVPGVLAARTLRSPREKLGTILTLPLMVCGAKLPLFLLLTAAFFPEDATLVMLILSLLAWTTALLAAKILRLTLIRGAPTPFVMELPPYRLPTLFGVLIHSLERVWHYIKKAGTLILAISVLVWAGMTYPAPPEESAATYAVRLAVLEETCSALPEKEEETRARLRKELTQAKNELNSLTLAHSWAGRLGAGLEPLTAPLGFDWRVNIALLGGLGAKEVIVSTLGTAYSLDAADPGGSLPLQQRLKRDPGWNRATAAGLMIFVLLYSPCFATLAVLRQESGHAGWAVFSLLFNTLLAGGAAAAARSLLMYWGI